MRHSLSEDSVVSLYDQGHKIFRNNFENFMVSLPLVDLEKALESSNPKKTIQSYSPQEVYFTLKAKDPSNLLSVLPHLSSEQFVKIVDYDVWKSDELVTKKLFSWLDLYKKIEPKMMIDRYRELDEEYQIAALSQYVKAYTEEEYEKMSEAEQDSLFAFPGKELYFSVVGLDKETHESVINFFEIAGEHNIQYAASLLAELTYNPPHEAHELIRQFRKARLEEDGFVSIEEATSFFRRLDVEKIKKEASVLSREKNNQVLSLVTEDFLKEVFSYSESHYKEKISSVQKNFLLLANALTEVTGVEVGDLFELKQLMKTAHGYVSLALEILSEGDIALGAKLLMEKYHVKDLFRFSLSYFYQIKSEFLLTLEKNGVCNTKKMRDELDTLKYGALLDRLDREFLGILGFEATELLKAFFGRFSFAPVTKNREYNEETFKTLSFAPISSLAQLHQAKLYLHKLQESAALKKA